MKPSRFYTFTRRHVVCQSTSWVGQDVLRRRNLAPATRSPNLVTSSLFGLRSYSHTVISWQQSSNISPPPQPTRLEDANPERVRGILLHPKALGNDILPGNLIYKQYKWTGNVRKIPVELSKGYFWQVSDLRDTDGKPVLSNERVIPSEEASKFPSFSNLYSLADASHRAELPSVVLETPTTATLVNISFRDNGYQNIASWAEPFRQAFPSQQCFTVSLTDHWMLYPFRGLLTRTMRNNTPVQQRDTTLVYFSGSNTTPLDEFRDVLRMHNVMINYVYLLDDVGRVRFAGSGLANEEDLTRLFLCTDELMSEEKNGGNKKKNQ